MLALRVLAALVLLAPFAVGQTAPTEPVEPLEPAELTGPTAEETAALCWLNRFRADPQAFGKLIVDGSQPDNAENVDWQMFTREIAALKPAPPVFFDPRLIDASRAHARYTIVNKEYGHRETKGRPGFTGEWPLERALAAGYTADVAECTGARGGSPLEVVTSPVVDAGPLGEGSGGMLEGRGHRVCMIDPRWRDVGVGLFPWGKGQVSSVHLFGEGRKDGCVLGGVAIEDHDGDAFYDVGEGLGGVCIDVGEFCTMSTASGAWRLDVPSGAKAARLVARLGSLEVEHKIAPGADNVQLDLLFDVKRRIADLEAKVAAVPDAAATQQRTLRLQILELRKPANPAETELAAEVAAVKAAALAGFGIWSTVDAQRTFDAAKRAFAGTVIEPWIRQAQSIDALARDAAPILAAEASPARRKRAADKAAAAERAFASITHGDLWGMLTRLRRDLLAAAEPAPPRAADK